jgi:hypothetical protein
VEGAIISKSQNRTIGNCVRWGWINALDLGENGRVSSIIEFKLGEENELGF